MRLFRRKAQDANDIYEPLVRTGFGGNTYVMDQRQRAQVKDLIHRYGRWVHLCTTINAQAAAAIKPRLFIVGGSADAVRRSKIGRAVDCKTMDFLRGRGGIDPGQHISKAMAVTDDIAEVTEHPALTAFNDANPHEERFSFWEGVYSDLQIAGRSFSLMTTATDAENAPPEGFWRMMPQYTTPLPGEDGEFLKGFQYKVGTDSKVYRPDEVMWFKVYDPSNPWGGVGRLEAWLKTVDADWAIVAYQEWLFRRGGSPDYVVVSKDAKMTDPQKKAFRAEWLRMFGALARRRSNLAFASGDIDLKKMQESMRDMEYQKGREIVRDEICTAFGVPKAIITSDTSNRAVADAALIQHMRYTVWPMVLRVQERINQQIMPRWSDRLLIVHDNPIPEDRALLIQDRESKLRSGYSVNQIRLSEGEPALDDPAADVPMVAAGIVPLGTPPPSAFPPVPVQDETETETAKSAGQTKSPVIDTDKAVSETATNVKRAETVISMKAWHMGEIDPCSCHKTKADEGQPARDDDFSDGDNPKMAKAIADEQHEKLAGVESSVQAGGDDVNVSAVMGDSDEWARDMAAVVNNPVAAAVEVAGSSAVQALEVGISFDMQNRRAIDYVKDTSRRIGNQTTDTFRNQIAAAIEAGLEKGESTDQIAKRLQAVDELIGRKAKMIARTETAFATIEGSVQGWEQSGVVRGKKWLLAPDACEFCRSVAKEYDQKVLDLRKEFKPLGSRVQSADDPTKFLAVDYVALNGPPLHPNDRCDLVPVLDDE